MKKVTDLQLQHLEDKHHRLDAKVEQLTSRVHMTPGEYLQARELKKRKLMLKDGILAIRHDLAAVSR
jgi:uncharacterized protein YdcH (DUF465 family)